MKSFSERNPFVIGAVGLLLTSGIVVGSLNYDKLPFLTATRSTRPISPRPVD